ncbi:MAG: hypothetical protein ACM3PV_00370 [Betaproteobacteria bacterium]
MKTSLIAAALCAAGLAACGTENATESTAKVPPQPIVAAAPAQQPVLAETAPERRYVPVYERYPAPKVESNMGEQEPLDPTEQEKH